MAFGCEDECEERRDAVPILVVVQCRPGSIFTHPSQVTTIISCRLSLKVCLV
jgi:hypothetical protein